MGKATTYSYSKLDTYQQCPFKFKLHYIDGNYAFNASVSTELGTAIHSCEENIAKAIQAGEKIDYIKLKNTLILKALEIEHRYPKDWITPDKANRLFKDKVREYLEQGIYRLERYMSEHPSYEIVGIEQKFQVLHKPSGQTFKGFIDRVIHDRADGSYIVQDIKTYPVAVKHEDLTTPLQFVVYTLAAEELYKCEEGKIRCQYDLPFCDVRQDAGTAGYMKRGEAKLLKVFGSIAEEDYHPHPSPLCNYCSYCATNPDAKGKDKFLCPYFSHWERTTRNKGDISEVENEWHGIDAHQAIMEGFRAKFGIKAD